MQEKRTQSQVLENLNTYINDLNFIAVPKDEFYQMIGDKDIILHIENKYSYPYTTIFETRNGILIGKSIPTDVNHLTPNRYFLSKNQSIVQYKH